MPIYTASVTGPAQFDGLSAATGLFDPAQNTGGSEIQVRINSILFSGPTAITEWTIVETNPTPGGQAIVILRDTALPFRAGGPTGFMLMLTNVDGVPWTLGVQTTGMTGTGIFTIDYDFVATQG